MRYRIRQAIIDRDTFKSREFIAEREVAWFWGLIKFWWPVWDARWRQKRQEAEADMHRDYQMRLPLAIPEEHEL